jgi:8-oxo-dGTP pyrophosphatase MutT (NUDIX family)
MPSTAMALALVRAFDASPEEEKSRELILALLELTEAPFSRDQFHPGHITCTALVLHPNGQQFLLMHHHRHRRWLLPGGHVEKADAILSDAAKREAIEETAVRIADSSSGILAGMDVHGIPARKGEPFHLHHDLIFAFSANSGEFALTNEAPEVVWCGLDEFARYELPSSITRAMGRAAALLGSDIIVDQRESARVGTP